MKLFLRITNLILAFVFVGTATGQTVSPVLAKFTGAGKGRMALVNDTLSPKVVTLEVKGFSVNSEGRPIAAPLNPALHLKLSATSVRLEPKQTYYVFYQASADAYPTWFTIFAVFSPANPKPGIIVRSHIGHTVYLYQKDTIQEQDLQIQLATYDPVRNRVHCVVKNSSRRLGRPISVTFSGTHKEGEYSGFPMIPDQRNSHYFDLAEKSTAPKEIQLRFDKFTLRSPVTVEEETSTPPSSNPSSGNRPAQQEINKPQR